MKRRVFFTVCLLLVSSLFVIGLNGCGKKDNTDKDGKEKETEEFEVEIIEAGDEDIVWDEEDFGTADDQQEGAGETGHAVDGKTAMIYYVDDSTGEITGKTIDAKDEYDIWAGLQDAGILTKECSLKSLTINEKEKKIDLDFNSATGDRIRSMGTTGETEITGCIINTYLEAYGCDGIRLTEEGKALETSHGASLDGYSGIVSF